jgi:TonB-dependent SusC/RagA subfamily outer membrane receptor
MSNIKYSSDNRSNSPDASAAKKPYQKGAIMNTKNRLSGLRAEVRVILVSGFLYAISYGQDSIGVNGGKGPDKAVTTDHPAAQPPCTSQSTPHGTKMAGPNQSVTQEYVTHVTLQKKEGAGTVTTFKSNDITKKSSSNVMEPLQGKAAGVRVMRTKSLQPGSPMSVRIRGMGSINSSNEPLYVVDGVPVRNIDYLNPNDVESVSILKNPSETSFYGSQGANGVVVISTKKAH